MEANRIRVLLVEDDNVDYLTFKRGIKEQRLPYDHVRAGSIAEAREILKKNTFDVALLDYRLGDGTAFDLFQHISEQTPFIIVTGSGHEEIAVQAMKAGASDYLIKDPGNNWLKTLPLTVHNAMKARRAEEALNQAHEELEQRVYQRTEELFKANQQLQKEIEQRKRAEEALRESEERFRALTETTSEWIWEVDADLRFTYASPRVVELLGFQPEEILGKTPFDLMLPIEAEHSRGQFREILASGQSFRDLENLYVHRDGHVLVLELSGLPFFDANGKSNGYRGIGRDMTERKRSAELLIQSERLQAVAELSAGVAHNFNNLLQIVLFCSEVGLHAVRSNDLARATSNLQQVLESCRSGAETVRRLHDFARNRPEPIREGAVFPLDHAVQKAIEMSETLWKTAPERDGIHIVLQQKLAPSCFVRGEENEFLEVVINLIKNAVEAMPKGGEISLEVAQEGTEAVLTVADNGAGIPEANLGKVFQPFFTTKGLQGTGMGLASSYGIVLRHGGQIHVRSGEDRGAKFVVRIPLAGESQGVETRDKIELRRPLRILVIDDQEPIVAMMEQLFIRKGHIVYKALSGSEGLDVFQRNPVDVVISDLSMPSMTGWQVGKALKDLCETKGIAKPLTLILTGWGAQQDHIYKSSEFGIDAIIEKPVNFERLMGKIRDLLHERERSSSGEMTFDGSCW
ncbi:MAG: response regulator [Desulfomonile tiedjei]|nr:response regulator [Desulfomonile tiedjei]